MVDRRDMLALALAWSPAAHGPAAASRVTCGIDVALRDRTVDQRADETRVVFAATRSLDAKQSVQPLFSASGAITGAVIGAAQDRVDGRR